MAKNKTIQEWMKNPKNTKNGLYLIPIGNKRIPVRNQICPICKKGWNSPTKFAVKDNKVYHLKCLQKRGLVDKDVIHE